MSNITELEALLAAADKTGDATLILRTRDLLSDALNDEAKNEADKEVEINALMASSNKADRVKGIGMRYSL